MHLLKFFVLLIAVTSGAAVAETYRWIDPATGRTMITDTPPPGKVKRVDKSRESEDSGPVLSPALRRAVDNFPVTLYTSANCVDECKQARELLTKRGVPFTEKAIQKPEDFAELKALIGDAFVPSLKVGSQTLKGFLADSYHGTLDLAGYPKTPPLGSKPAGE